MDNDPWWLRVSSRCVTGVLYFIGGFLVALFGILHYTTSFIHDNWGGTMMLCVGAGLFAAFTGPRLHQIEKERGSGKLREIRKNSKYGD